VCCCGGYPLVPLPLPSGKYSGANGSYGGVDGQPGEQQNGDNEKMNNKKTEIQPNMEEIYILYIIYYIYYLEEAKVI